MFQQKYNIERAPTQNVDEVNILVVDDSAIVRGFISRWIDAEPDLHVVATAASGQSALAMLRVNNIDVVVLDIEMPGMDGIAALPKILEENPHVQVIMASTLTLRNAEISMQALSLGAADYVAKPRSSLSADAGMSFRRELVSKIRSLSERSRRLRKGNQTKTDIPSAQQAPMLPQVPAFTLRSAVDIVPKILAIGSSTGGPQALFTLLGQLNRPFPVPIVITQHMPATFTAILAQHIQRLTGLESHEAAPDMAMLPGRVYVAPGDRHLEFVAGSPMQALITDHPPVNFCRPAVDPMFKSLVKVYGKDVLGIILTGMGKDGMAGAADIVAAGGMIYSQDEDSSVVWGMPRAVAQAGLSSFIGPLDKIAMQINALFGLEAAR